MKNKVELDFLNEALRISWLEYSKEADINTARRELSNIFNTNYIHEPNSEMSDHMIQTLQKNIIVSTFGALLNSTMLDNQFNERALAEKSNLPESIITALKEDKIFINNVPIMLFKNLLNVLNISFQKAEEAILGTYEVLKRKSEVNVNQISGFQLAFRRGHSQLSGATFSQSGIRGNELFENEGALKKYLSRLNELMNS